MAKFTRSFVRDNEEMSVQTDTYSEMEQIIVELDKRGWKPEQNNWAGLVMATPDKPTQQGIPGDCPHHPGKMRDDKKVKGAKYCSGKLDNDTWCGYATNPDGTVKRRSKLDQPVQSILLDEDEIDF